MCRPPAADDDGDFDAIPRSTAAPRHWRTETITCPRQMWARTHAAVVAINAALARDLGMLAAKHGLSAEHIVAEINDHVTAEVEAVVAELDTDKDAEVQA